MTRLLLAGACLGSLAGVTPAAAQFTALPFIGQTITIATEYCPQGWATMNGQILPIAGFSTLYSILRDRYGGDGVTTFALPTAKPVMTATGATLTRCIATQGNFPTAPP